LIPGRGQKVFLVSKPSRRAIGQSKEYREGFNLGVNRQLMKMTTHIYLVAMLRIREAMLQLPLHIPLLSQEKFHFV
jgi:hypothetical protein